MHIPDGFLNGATTAVTAVAAGGGLAGSLKMLGQKLGEKQVPLLGITAAFVFGAQMLNFPIAGGTSGHFLGAALCAILLGPWAAVVILSLVLVLQCFLFQDGGITALGANIFNMGIIGGFGAYFIYRVLGRVLGQSNNAQRVAAFGAAWFSVVLASVACAIELGLSGASPFKIVLPAMVGVHSLIGLVEGAITVAALALVATARSGVMVTPGECRE